jgi:hypothetical protein
MRTSSHVTFTENQNSHFMFNNIFPENLAVYEIMWKIYGRAGHATVDHIIRRMRTTCYIPNATDKHSGYIIPITFPQQQLLHEDACITYIACLVI